MIGFVIVRMLYFNDRNLVTYIDDGTAAWKDMFPPRDDLDHGLAGAGFLIFY